MNNYSRFYALLNRLPVHDEEIKERLVLQYTGGRTPRLREMTSAEYRTMCDALDRSLKDGWSIRREQLRKYRSAALKQMQRLGIDTTDWARINAFCRDPRIAGREFGALDPEALEALAVTLRSIERRGGLKQLAPQPALKPRAKQHIIYVPLDGLPN